MSQHSVDRAYKLQDSEEARDLYADWATTYDTSFGAAMGYAAPRLIAETFLTEAGADHTPVLDIGAGTGMLAEHLAGVTVDGIDLSREMLEQARNKGLYRNHIIADLLQPLDLADASYGGFTSSGTFTHGHVGPACLPELLRIAKPGALFVCGTVPKVYDGMGFGSALALLLARGQIADLRFRDIPIYENADHAHANDRGLIMIFRRR